MSKLIRKARGKETVIAVGSRKELLAKMQLLRISTMRGVRGRGGKKYRVEYRIEEDDKPSKQ